MHRWGERHRRHPDDHRNELRWGKRHRRYPVDHRNELLDVGLLVRKSNQQSTVHLVRSIEQDRICLSGRFDELLIFVPVAPVDDSSPQPVFLDLWMLPDADTLVDTADDVRLAPGHQHSVVNPLEIQLTPEY